MNHDSSSKRKWLQISLKSLLMLMLLTAVFVAGWKLGRVSAPQAEGKWMADLDADGDLDVHASDGSRFHTQGDGKFIESFEKPPK